MENVQQRLAEALQEVRTTKTLLAQNEALLERKETLLADMTREHDSISSRYTTICEVLGEASSRSETLQSRVIQKEKELEELNTKYNKLWAEKEKEASLHAKDKQDYRAENLRLREAFKPMKIKVAEELNVEVKKLKRKCADYEERLETLEEDNEELQNEIESHKSSFSRIMDVHQELHLTKLKLKQADKEWEAERREKLKVMDELDAAKRISYTWEMLSKERGVVQYSPSD